MLGKVLAVLVALPVALLFAVAMSALFAWPVQLLSNYLLTSFGAAWGLTVIPLLSFKEAWALSLLCSLLFKSSK